MADIINAQQNNVSVLTVLAAPVIDSSYLIYNGGGGNIFGNSLVNDVTANGTSLYYGGNPPLDSTNTPIYKQCGLATVTNKTIQVQSDNMTRGLFVYENNSDSLMESNAQYYWDEVYTSPLGFHEVIASGSDIFKFSSDGGNVITFRTMDVNIVPKQGDYLVMQKLNDYQANLLPDNVKGYSGGDSSFTDGISNMPVLYSTQTYQFEITNVNYTSPVGIETEYVAILDKSMNVEVGEHYGLILLNRQNTGIQKELFYDTFQQFEVHRDQLLGDPYFNVSTISQPGRKNYLNYTGANLLGIRNLLLNEISSNNQQFIETPFLVFDAPAEVRDRFLPVQSSITNTNFEFHLPTVMIQENVNDNLNILTNYGSVINEIDGVGRYSALYLKWSPVSGKSYGNIFYDLRIIVIDDPELVTALSYNSNRNYTLPAPSFNSIGNSSPTKTSNTNLQIIGLISNAGSGVVVIVNGNHGLSDGTAVTISGVKVMIPGTNQIQNASADGLKYIRRFYIDPINQLNEQTDRFYIYEDSGLVNATIGNGIFINNGLGNSGIVTGASLPYNYFYTYRIKNSTYSSILPYANSISFNFANSITDSSVNNINGALYINIPKFTFLNHINGGFTVDDLELIIGQWEASDPTQPNIITGISNVVAISIQDTTTGTLPNSVTDLNIILQKATYDSYVSKIGNAGVYDYTTNINGNPEYDILNNFLHYNITSGTLSPTLYTGNEQWLIGNIIYKNEVDQFRSIIKIPVLAGTWNDTMNPSYDANNPFITDKYISEVALCNSTSDVPLIYAKISPAIKKPSDMDLMIQLSLDF